MLYSARFYFIKSMKIYQFAACCFVEFDMTCCSSFAAKTIR